MNTLTEKQNLCYDLLKANNYDVKNAKACYDFVTAPEPQPTKTANGLADGVYLIRHDDTAVLFTGQTLTDTEKSLYKGVGVKLGNKSLAVAMGDMTEDEITLTKEQGGTRFITKYHEAVADWNGKENTDDIRGILNDDILLSDGEYIPSLGELYFILLHIRDINAALEAIGGKLLCGWYWASTQYSATYAWLLYLGNGFAGSNTRATNQDRVRAVSAFLPLNS
ncbi:hypothetical protein [uncultured Bacteroides sp.]|uniref:hypothetical protein n=1 Tax=uncultured Bacteroides sp. TaxID=162156 RepID=UPI0025EC8C85|nr:hypothetical protein [uncultured Bacteroides sp.]